MAAYAQTTNFLVSIKRVMEIWNNTIDEINIANVMVLLDTEFAAMETAGLAGYTVTSGLQASIDAELNNISNNTMKYIIKNFTTLLLAEFALVETNGLAYTVTANTSLFLGRTLENVPNQTHKKGLYQIRDIMNTELAALEAAS